MSPKTALDIIPIICGNLKSNFDLCMFTISALAESKSEALGFDNLLYTFVIWNFRTTVALVSALHWYITITISAYHCERGKY